MDNENKPLACGCPGSNVQQFDDPADTNQSDTPTEQRPSQLRQWPVQLMLVPPNAPYFQKADLALTADCVPFAYNNFHEDYLKGRPIAIACPKLDNLEYYIEKLTEIIKVSELSAIEVLVMEVPCCTGLAHAAIKAREQSGTTIPIKITTIGVRGEVFKTDTV